MLRVKRTKQGPPTVQAKDGKRVEVPGPTAVHYATRVQPNGGIAGWSVDPQAAVAVTEGAARRIREFHAGKRHVGALDFEEVAVDGVQLAQAVAAEDAIGAAEFAKLQAECQRLQARVRELQDQAAASGQANDEAKSREKAAAAALQAATERASQLELEMVAQAEKLATAQARVLELEAAQAEKQAGKKK